jgi:hypothetical protein
MPHLMNYEASDFVAGLAIGLFLVLILLVAP